MAEALVTFTDANLIAELLVEHATLTKHAARCGGRCQDYRDAVAAEDAILEEMGARQGLGNWTPADHPPLPALSADPRTH